MKIFIINLEKDIKKKDYMKKLSCKNNLEIEFINAINGNNLNHDSISKVYSKQATLNYFSRELTKGEIGTALSHLHIYNTMIKENIHSALILEDDVDFNFTEKDLDNLVESLPKDWECVLLGHHTKRSRDIDTLPSFWHKHKITDTLECNRLAEEAFGAYGYLINTKGALKSLHQFRTIDRPIDHWSDKLHNLYAISPSIIKINDDFTDASSLASARKIAGENITRTLFQRIKDSVRFFLEKFNLSGVYYICRDFIVQFKILKRYTQHD